MKNKKYMGMILECICFMVLCGLWISGIANQDKMYCEEHFKNVEYQLTKVENLGLKSKYQKVTYTHQSHEMFDYLFKNEAPAQIKVVKVCSERMLLSKN